jgi:hypothetical protein
MLHVNHTKHVSYAYSLTALGDFALKPLCPAGGFNGLQAPTQVPSPAKPTTTSVSTTANCYFSFQQTLKSLIQQQPIKLHLLSCCWYLIPTTCNKLP